MIVKQSEMYDWVKNALERSFNFMSNLLLALVTEIWEKKMRVLAMVVAMLMAMAVTWRMIPKFGVNFYMRSYVSIGTEKGG